MNINDSIAKNLDNFMKERKLSANTIARAAGVTPSTITRFLSREIKSLNLDVIYKISKYYNEPMVKFLSSLKSDISGNNAEIVNNSDIVYIKFYQDVEASAGSGNELYDDGEIVDFPVSLSFLQSKGLSSENVMIVRVNGDSMSPTLMDKDLVIITTNFSPTLNGIYVIRDSNNGLRVKRLDRDKAGNLKVISDNKNYETLTYTLEELENNEIEIIGMVVIKITGV